MSYDPDVVLAIREILNTDSQLREHRNKVKELENRQSSHRELLKDRFGNNTIIRTNTGNITIKERQTEGKLSLQDIRRIIEPLEWIEDSIKERLVTEFKSVCNTKRKYSKTLTVRR